MPLQIELGVLKEDDELWVETFENWYAEGEFLSLLNRRRCAFRAFLAANRDARRR